MNKPHLPAGPVFPPLALLIALFAVSCASGPIDISQDLTAAELVQRAQEASDRNRYEISLQYYEAIIERFPTDIDMLCAAEYEIGFIYYKQRKLAEAKQELTALLVRYDTVDKAFLPQQFERLARIVLDRITELERELQL